MRTEEELFKKKKKKSYRFIKFIFILIFIIAVVSLIFYSFENPSFLKEIKDKLLSFYSEAEKSTESAQIDKNLKTKAEVESETEKETKTEKVKDIKNNSTVIEGTAVKNISLWKKIINFFKEEISSHEEEFPSRLKIKVYFASLGQEQKFIYEERSIVAGELKIAVENAVKELIKGPLKSYHYPVIPAGTKLVGVEIYENLAKIDFSQEFLKNSLDSGILDEYVIYTIVNTVTEIPGIEGVIFLIEGSRIKFYGSVDLSIPAIRDEKYLPEDEK